MSCGGSGEIWTFLGWREIKSIHGWQTCSCRESQNEGHRTVLGGRATGVELGTVPVECFEPCSFWWATAEETAVGWALGAPAGVVESWCQVQRGKQAEYVFYTPVSTTSEKLCKRCSQSHNMQTEEKD